MDRTVTKRRSHHRIITILLALALLASACTGSDDSAATGQRGSNDSGATQEPDGTASQTNSGTNAVTVRATGDGIADTDTEITITLEDGAGGGDAGAPDAPRETTVEGTTLGDADVALLLDRLPDLAEQAADRSDFRRPPQTRPRPRPGTTLDQSFPPTADATSEPVTDPGPLEVLRYQPEGPVDLAPFISVTFNQPMISLATLDQIEAGQVPVTITPEMPGRFIWLGTRTVRFEYEPGAIDRIPAATNYVVEIGAGTESINGSTLDEPVVFEFSTPPVQVRGVSPLSDSMSTTPIFFVEFDQRVDPGAALETITLAVNATTTAIRLANGEEIAEDPHVLNRSERALPERWLAFRPVDELPTGATIDITVGPRIPSLEGPELSEEIERFSGRTYGPFVFALATCGWGDSCSPGDRFVLEFSNPIDAQAFSSDQVRIDPEIPQARIGVSGRSISIQGRTKGRTTYSITVDASLTDIYGQELGADATAEITVDDAPSAIFNPGRQLVTLDPIVDDATLNVTTINNDELVVTAYEVDPRRDWISYLENGWRLAEPRENWTSPWRQIGQRRIATGAEPNDFTEVAIDLSDELGERGHAIVVIEPPRFREEDWANRPFAVWVQRTTLGLDAVTDNTKAITWVTDLRTGEPIVGANVSLIGADSGTTDADGIAQIKLADNVRGAVVEAQGETALIGDFWADFHNANDQTRWYVINDRGLYKPGEAANLKGWVRQSDAVTPSDLSLIGSGPVRWFAQDNFGNEIGNGETTLSELGGFDLTIEIPEDITLGGVSVRFSADSANGSGFHQFQVQEFRRPDFEVTTEITSPEPRFAGDTLLVDAEAAYFAGGPLAGSQVDWQVTGRTSSYSPPNWPDFDFGIWEPWWFSFRSNEFDDFGFGGGFGGGVSEFFSSTTDEAGAHTLAATVATEGKPRPVTVSASATVIDVNRQPISSTTNTLLHPAELYVGLRGGSSFVQPGDDIDVDVIVTDLDGELVAGTDVLVTSTRLEWRFEDGQWNEVPVTDGACELASAPDPTTCTFEPSSSGRYRITATTDDADGRTNLTELTRWVAGGEGPTSRRVDLENLTLIPEGDSWQPGETARILVQAPFADAHGLAVVSRSSIDRTLTFDFDETGSAVLEIPVTEGDIGGIGLQIETVGSAPRSPAEGALARPAYATGMITLPVPPDGRALTIDVAPRLAKLEPGAETQVDVAITGPDGEPVADAEMVVIVVDEAVLSLSGYQLGDPLDAFYPANSSFAQSWRGRATLLLSDPQLDDLALEGGGGLDSADESAEMMSIEADGDFAFDDAAGAPAPEAARAAVTTLQSVDKAGGESAPAIELRSDFDALAVFEPDVTTDADGRATIDVPLPDNLTRYRVMVVATSAATDAGSGESNITARLPVTVRPTPPRFANFGDVFEFPIVVQNATDEPLEVDVALRSTNLVVQDRDGATVSVPANDRVEVRFEVAADEAGTARFQVAASAGSYADAAEGSFPVYTPATAEAFATYGVIDGGSLAQPLTGPVDVFPQFGGLEITTSSTAVSALTDAVIYLHEYRYDTSDAFASRIIAIVALDELLQSFEAERLPTPEALRQTINQDIDGLASMQNNDGGFPSWRRGRESVPYNSVQATHALVLAQEDGFVVGEQTLADALWYLANIEDHIPSWYSPATRRAIGAYAVHVRWLAGDRDVAKATSIYGEANGEQLDVAAWLWPVLDGTRLDDEIERLFNNRVTETPNAATFATNYGEQAWVLLHSDRRTDAIVLDSFLRMRPDSDLVLKTLNGLLAARDNRGHWRSIQENSFILLAGSAYFDAFEDVDPDFIARAWLGDEYAVEHTYQGRSTERNATLVPMDLLVEQGDSDIVLAKDGTDGRLYYRLGLRYAPTDFELEPRDQGFVVQRSYEGVDDPADVIQNDDGSWTVKAGTRVRVRVTMVADSRRTHVALLDPMPAGFEALNPALATTEPIPQADPSEGFASRFWWYRWFDHQNLRDDRAEAFATWLGAGAYEYTYVARATTPGTFVVPPARAEQMYEPEVFGRSANTTVTITD